jgi:uncharacterized small protein (DUF1192 family)
MDVDELPRMRHDAAALLAGERLDSYSQDELVDRIALLEAEIVRVKAHHAKAADHRKFADQLFKRPGSAGGSD